MSSTITHANGTDRFCVFGQKNESSRIERTDGARYSSESFENEGLNVFCKMNVRRLFALIVFAAFAILMTAVVEVRSSPQRTSPQRGRAISGFNRANDADYDEEEEYTGPPRKYGRKGYRSNCRCARISNCPKLQITIPRCPPEEFVCCFN